MYLAIHPLQGTVQGLQRRNVPVGACWPHQVELLSFLTLLWALGGICLVLDFAQKYLQSVLLSLSFSWSLTKWCHSLLCYI